MSAKAYTVCLHSTRMLSVINSYKNGNILTLQWEYYANLHGTKRFLVTRPGKLKIDLFMQVPGWIDPKTLLSYGKWTNKLKWIFLIFLLTALKMLLFLLCPVCISGVVLFLCHNVISCEFLFYCMRKLACGVMVSAAALCCLVLGKPFALGLSELLSEKQMPRVAWSWQV